MKDRLLSTGVCVRDCHVDLAPVGIPPTLVSVKVPLEISDERVASILKEFGKVDSHVLRRKYHFADIETGIRVFKLENVTTRLPSFLLIEGCTCTLPVYTCVAGQPPTCYRCGSPTLFIRDCQLQHGLRGSPSNISEYSEHEDEQNSRSPSPNNMDNTCDHSDDTVLIGVEESDPWNESANSLQRVPLLPVMLLILLLWRYVMNTLVKLPLTYSRIHPLSMRVVTLGRNTHLVFPLM